MALGGTAIANHPGGADTISSGDVQDNSLTSADVQDYFCQIEPFRTCFGGLATEDLQNGVVTSSKLALGSVGAREIADHSIGSAELGDSSVGNPELKPLSVTAINLTSNSVPASRIQENAVQSSEIAPGAVGGSEIAAGSVGDSDLADDAVGARALKGIKHVQAVAKTVSDRALVSAFVRARCPATHPVLVGGGGRAEAGSGDGEPGTVTEPSELYMFESQPDGYGQWKVEALTNRSLDPGDGYVRVVATALCLRA